MIYIYIYIHCYKYSNDIDHNKFYNDIHEIMVENVDKIMQSLILFNLVEQTEPLCSVV